MTFKTIILALIFALLATGCTCVSAKKKALFVTNRLFTVDVIHGICVAPLAGWKRMNGVQVALQGLAEKGHGIQVAGILCATASWDGLMLAPVCLCMNQNNRVQVGFIALTSVLSG